MPPLSQRTTTILTWAITYTGGTTSTTLPDMFASNNSAWPISPLWSTPPRIKLRFSPPPPCPKDLRAAPQTEPRPAARITAPLRRTRKQKRRHWMQQLRKALA